MRFTPSSLTLLCSSLVVLLSTGTDAQSSTATAIGAIPTGISTGCSAFLTKLNSDATIKSCTAPLLSATDYYANATSKKSEDSKDALQTTLSSLCASSAGCDSSVIRSYLSNFWIQCMTEIKAKNEEVQQAYDVLYLLNPFREAICSKDDKGNYCLTTVSSTSSKKRDIVAVENGNDLTRRQTATDEVSETGTNIAFLFLQPTSGKDKLCGTCAQNILASYIQFETSIPYAIGLANSEFLKGQSDLYKAGKETCGDSWAKKVNSIAGTTDFAKVAGALANHKVSIALATTFSTAAGLALWI